MLPQLQEKGKRFLSFLTRGDIYITLIVICVGFCSFGLGILYARDIRKPPVTIQQTLGGPIATSTINRRETLPLTPPNNTSTNPSQKGTIVASKKGTRYHLLSCPGASQIKEENRIYFSSSAEAEEAGYTRAANCK
jgi:hypothetical protein